MNAPDLLSLCLTGVVQSLVLAAVIDALLRAIPHFHAGARHRILLGTLSVTVAFPVVDALAQSQPAPLFASAGTFGALTIAEPLVTGAMIVWALVSFALFGRLGVSLWRLHQLRRSSSPADARIQLRAGELARQRHMRAVDVRTCACITSPIAIAFGKPVILFPCRLARELKDEELDFILLHELMHLQRRDGISNLFAKLANTGLDLVRWDERAKCHSELA